MLCYYDGVMFFFFKQKTAYEMRISDWSSDVCSSDLLDRKGDVGLCDFEQENGLTQDIARILDSEGRLGHPREARKFVDHAPHVMNLPDHRIGKLDRKSVV